VSSLIRLMLAKELDKECVTRALINQKVLGDYAGLRVAGQVGEVLHAECVRVDFVSNR
jgi:hypothetical protein